MQIGRWQIIGIIPLQLDQRLFARISVCYVRVSAEQRIAGERAALAFVIGIEDDEDIFQCDLGNDVSLRAPHRSAGSASVPSSVETK